MRESDDDVVRRGRLFADTLRFTLTDCGDYATPIARGVIAREAIEGDLFDLCSGRIAGRRSAEEITVFKNGGGGHLDLIVARAIWDFREDERPRRPGGRNRPGLPRHSMSAGPARRARSAPSLRPDRTGLSRASSLRMFASHVIEEGFHLGRRLQVMNALRRRRVRDKLPVPGVSRRWQRQITR